MDTLFKDAIRTAGKVRRELGLKLFKPINIFDVCETLGLTVRFVDISMEGFYIRQGKEPNIMLSSLRPLPRRCFTCAHELGHHRYGHGSRLDILSEREAYSNQKDKDEILVDAFAGALLMPVGGIQAEFMKRAWDIDKATPLQFCTISSVFGVGYSTLITHCKMNNLIAESKALSLSKFTPSKIFQNQFSPTSAKSYFKIVDQFSELRAVDLEVSNYIVVPGDTLMEENSFEKIANTRDECIYMAKKPGIFSATLYDRSYFIRVQNLNYVGLAAYRHLEN